MQRDPRKRRVKPVQKHLIQVDFGGADDSDDSDFELDKHKKGTYKQNKQCASWAWHKIRINY